MIKKGLLVCLTAGLFMMQPMHTDAAQLSLALSGGISSSLDVATTADSDMAEALDEAVKTTYTGFCVAKVDDYVNVRSTASEDGEVVGKMYNKSAGTVEGEENGWYLITSGNVHGYVKNDYVAILAEADALAEEAGTRSATVITETLRIREEATIDSAIMGLVPLGEKLIVIEETDTFVKVDIEEGAGWVSKDYVELQTDYTYAESIEEEQARLAKEEEARRAAKRAAEAKAQKQAVQAVVGTGAGSASGNAVAGFASQFVGNPYVYGGTSLTNGADCSGFVMSVYANFGVGLPHSSSAMRGVGYGVSLADAQPGDIICYSGHVGIYVGNNTIVHASTAKTGIKFTSPVTYKNVLAVRRIF